MVGNKIISDSVNNNETHGNITVFRQNGRSVLEAARLHTKSKFEFILGFMNLAQNTSRHSQKDRKFVCLEQINTNCQTGTNDTYDDKHKHY